MATLKVNWSFASQVDGGPQFSASQPIIEISGFDYEKQIVAAGGSQDVAVKTASAKMILIFADNYAAGVNYDIDNPAVNRKLDTPQIFMGQGGVAWMTSATKLTFHNPLTSAVTVQVFIGS